MTTKQAINKSTEQTQTVTADNTPTNAVTGKAYFGNKAERLRSEAAYRGYSSNSWATLKQWNSIKETIAKGQKGTLMIHTEEMPDGTVQEKRSFLYNRCQLVSVTG